MFCAPGSRAPPEDQILKTGFLEKQGLHVKDWRRRFCVLTPTSIMYYTDSDCKTLRGSILLSHAPASPIGEFKDRDYCFEVATEGRTYYLAAETAEGLSDWIRAINSVNLAGALKIGYLLKEGFNNPSWKKRFFVLREEGLSYYMSPESPQPQGTIEITNADICPYCHCDDRPHCISIELNEDVAERVYRLDCESEECREEWMRTFNEPYQKLVHHMTEFLFSKAHHSGWFQSAYGDHALTENRPVAKLPTVLSVGSMRGKKTKVVSQYKEFPGLPLSQPTAQKSTTATTSSQPTTIEGEKGTMVEKGGGGDSSGSGSQVSENLSPPTSEQNTSNAETPVTIAVDGDQAPRSSSPTPSPQLPSTQVQNQSRIPRAPMGPTLSPSSSTNLFVPSPRSLRVGRGSYLSTSAMGSGSSGGGVSVDLGPSMPGMEMTYHQFEELDKMARGYAWAQSACDRAFDAYDINKDNILGFFEFSEAVLRGRPKVAEIENEKEFRVNAFKGYMMEGFDSFMFDKMDRGKEGYLRQADIPSLFEQLGFPTSFVRSALHDVTRKYRGDISREQFCEIFAKIVNYDRWF